MSRVTIAVPVYNGADFLEECLEALRGQTYRAFQVAIFDNASSDATPDIAARFAREDTRFQLHRSETNIGALPNFTRALDAATSELFAWRAHDDLSDALYLEKLVGALDRDPRAVLAAARIRRLRLRAGAVAGERIIPFTTSARAAPFARFADNALNHMHQSWFYGLWRRDAVSTIYHDVVARFPHAWASDVLMLVGALAMGGITGSDETTFTQRIMVKASQDKTQAAPGAAALLASQRRDFRAMATDYASPLTQGAIERLALWLLMDRLTSKRVGSRTRLLKLRLRNAIAGGAKVE